MIGNHSQTLRSTSIRAIGLGLLIALSSGGLLPDAAHATCGDYLLHAQSDQAQTQSSLTPSVDGTSVPAPPSPCTGPGCRRAPQPPLGPTSPEIELTTQDVGFAVNDQFQATPPSVWYGRRGHHLHAADARLRVDRPPQGCC